MWTWCEYTECMKKAVTNFCWLWLYAVAWYVALRYRTDFQVRSREREITSRWLNKKHWYYSKQATMVSACVAKKEDNDWVKKCMEYEAEGTRPRGRPKRTWREVVEKDCQARKLNKDDAVDHSRWRKLIKDVRWSGWVWVGECLF